MQATLNRIGSDLQHAFDGLDTPARRSRRHMTAARLHERSGTSDALAAMIIEHQESVAEGIRQCDRLESDLKAAVQGASAADEIGGLLAAVDGARTDGPWLGEMAVRLAARKLELADQVVAELKPLPAELRETAEAVVAEVKKSLEKIGCGVAAQQAAIYGNKEAAERQFDLLARNVNLRSRAATAAVVSAEAELTIARQVAGAARHELNAARASLVEIAKRALTA
ncbi:MAG: hypothetical protein C0485_04325 [Pirellula sp.]|nr:hypothetical protein [Pirellula sp.]